MAEIKRCKTPFAFEQNGMTRVVAAGSLVTTDDPAYAKATAEHFEDVDVHVEAEQQRRAKASGVEQATAAPGEKRSVRGRKSVSGRAARNEPPAADTPEDDDGSGSDVQPAKR